MKCVVCDQDCYASDIQIKLCEIRQNDSEYKFEEIDGNHCLWNEYKTWSDYLRRGSIETR